MISQWQLRAAFAARLSGMYGREVPAYTTLVDVSREVNPATERDLAAQRLAYFTYRLALDRPRDGSRPPTAVGDLLHQGWIRAELIVYEDFLPRSAAGIFQSNLSGEGSRDNDREGAADDAAWLSGAVGREVLDPFALYEQQQNHSLARVARELHLDGPLS